MKKWRRLACLLSAVLLCMVLVPVTAHADNSGNCGDGVSWVLNPDGVLVISGEGAIDDYDDNNNASPFSDAAIAEEIRSVKIADGITRIGNNVFAGRTKITSVSIPDTLESIGENAFSFCTGLEEVHYAGTARQWKRVTVEAGNDFLEGCEIEFDKIVRPGLRIVILVCVLVVVLAAAAAAGICLFRIRKKSKSVSGETSETPGLPRVGKVHQQGDRESQQDSFSVSSPEQYPSRGLCAVVADGMGGLQDGDRVSQTAVQAIMDRFCRSPAEPPEDLLLDMLHSGVLAVNRLLGPERITQCGSTALIGLLREGWFYYLSVGDSKIVQYRKGRITVLNREHSFLRELELRAVNGETTLEEARSHPRRAGLTSYLGMGPLAQLDQPAGPVAAEAGDKFILMSDGVWNALTQEELSRALAGDAETAAEAVRQAVEAKNWPGQDNYTAVIIEL